MNPELVKFHLPTTDQFSVAVDTLDAVVVAHLWRPSAVAHFEAVRWRLKPISGPARAIATGDWVNPGCGQGRAPLTRRWARFSDTRCRRRLGRLWSCFLSAGQGET
jgi:hypothetical protein